MKRILAIAIMLCLVLPLFGCGGKSPAPKPAGNDETVEQSENPAEDSGSNSTQDETQGFTIETGIGEDGGEVTVNTGDSIVWDPEKMGGMPQPEGVMVVMEMDMTKILGETLAYSYSVTGLTKEVFEAYTELAAKTFPKVFESILSETEGSFVASTEDLSQQFSVVFNEGNQSIIQYIN